MSAPVLVAQDLRRSYGERVVLDGVSLALEPGERVALVGVNGSGKTTLARILAGEEPADAGEVIMRGGAQVAVLSQEPRFLPNATAEATALEGLREWADAMARHDAATAALSAGEGDVDAHLAAHLAAQGDAAAAIERLGGWSRDAEARAMLQQLRAPDGAREVATMSGGERRRVALARALVARPDLLVLDEPTNHLDVETIEWLERHLADEAAQPGSVLVITHDRAFLDAVATRTIELEHGKVFSYDGGFTAYLEARAEREAHEDRVERNRQNLLRRELAWLRRGPKARTTKQKARVQRAEAVVAQSGPKRRGEVKLGAEVARAGRTLLTLDRVSIHRGEQTLVRDLTLTVDKGECIGIVGPNGAGKSSLLAAMLDEPSEGLRVEGSLRRSEKLQVVLLDQARSGLDPAKSIVDNVSDGGRVVFAGQNLDARTYLERFLFAYREQDRPVATLSGGERVRVLLARLLLQPMNLLVLDEPTNDLDLHTLRALEAMIAELEATVLLVTHDRWMLDRLATQVLAFEGDGAVVPYAGGYSDLLAQRAQREPVREPSRKTGKTGRKSERPPSVERPEGPRPLRAREREELDALPGRIDEAEQHLEACATRIGAEVAGTDAHAEAMADYEAATAALEALMARWEELESRS